MNIMEIRGIWMKVTKATVKVRDHRIGIKSKDARVTIMSSLAQGAGFSK